MLNAVFEEWSLDGLSKRREAISKKIAVLVSGAPQSE